MRALRSGRRSTAGSAAGLTRVRRAVTVFFAADGFIFASWAVRIPAVKTAVGASPAALGLALLGVSVGAVATMTITGALCRRFGSAPVTVVSATWLSLAMLLPPLAPSAVTLGLALIVFGIGYGGLNVAMNAVAVEVVEGLRRPVMPSFHAALSFGGLAGAAVGGLVAPHLAPLPHLALVSLLGLVVTAVSGPRLFGTGTDADADAPAPIPAPASIPAPAPDDMRGPVTAAAQGRAWRVVLLSGLIAMCGAYGEGAIGDWGALHLRQDLHVSAALAAAGYAAFALAEACGRLAGSTLLARLGLTRVLVFGGFTACGGMLLAALFPAPGAALLGFALTGAGVANLFPAAMTRAGAFAGANGVALASTLGYAGFLLGPPAIGFLASRVGLGMGLVTVSFLALAASLIAYLSRHQS